MLPHAQTQDDDREKDEEKDEEKDDEKDNEKDKGEMMTKEGRKMVRPLVLALVLFALGATDRATIEPGTDYGAGLSLKQVSSLPDAIAKAEDHASDAVLVRGRISEVCQRKGCWTILEDADTTVRVRFKDYGFFLPKDSSGRQAYVEGVVTIQTLSEKQARHYASETKNGNPAAIHGPQREIGFVASGVRLIDPH